jgi:Protein of unknown function (DUF1638)
VSKKATLCLVSCSVLKEEIERLVKQGDLDVDLAFVSKYFHVEYELLEKNLRQVVEKTLTRFPGRVILVHGDLCLGQNNEMKKLAEEYGVVKVDALNCIDCQLGGKGKFLDADPNHDLMFLGPGMIGFFRHFKEKMQKENVDEQALANLFSGLKGIVIIDTLGEANKIREEVEKLNNGLTILETKEIGLENLKQVILEAIARHNQKAARTPAK